MNLCRNAWHWLNDKPHQLTGIRVLQITIGVAVLFEVLTSLPFATFLWGPSGIGTGQLTPVLGPDLGAPFDYLFTFDAGVFLILLVLAAGALGLLLGYATRLSTLLVTISFFLIIQRHPALGDGGDNVMKIVLIYMCLLLPRDRHLPAGNIEIWLHNIGVLAIGLQMIVLYATSGFAKAMGQLWQQGVAMYYISQVQWFSLPNSQSLFTNPWIVTATTYIPMIYQLLFPIAVISRIKVPWILLGIFFHLGIIIMMGLVSFSTVMIGLELFFLSDREYVMIWQTLLTLWKSLWERRAMPFSGSRIKSTS